MVLVYVSFVVYLYVYALLVFRCCRLRLHLAHEAEVEEGEPAVVGDQHVA